MQLKCHHPALVLALGLVLAGCGKPDNGVKIDVSIDSDLKSDIKVEQSDGNKPGTTGGNAAEMKVVLRNTGSQDHRVLIDGYWKDDRGNEFGGASDSRVIKAGAITTFSTATRSAGVTRMEIKVTPTNLSKDELTFKKIKETKNLVPGYGLSFTDTPTLDQIPNWPPKGEVNGTLYKAGTVLFAPINGTWEMQVIDRKIDPFKGIGYARTTPGNKGLQSLHITLKDPPKAGKVYDRKMSYGGGHWQIQNTPGSEDTTSWNTQYAMVLEITKWDLKPYEEGGKHYQQGGTASGRIYVCYKSSELSRIESSFVAGVFEDVPIIYYGRPQKSLAKAR